MSNAFDSTNYPSQVPVELQLGDFWAWKREDLSQDYPVAAYSLSYEFNLVDGATVANFTLTASESGDDYIIEESSTASYTKGNYNWVSYITRSSDSARVKLEEGFVEIQDNYATTLVAAPTGELYSGPTLFLKGENSAYIQDKHQPIIEQMFPRGQLQVVANAGHWLHAEQPQVVNGLIAAFLGEHHVIKG